MLEHGSSEGFSWGKSVAGEFVEGSGLPFDSPKPTTDRRITFLETCLGLFFCYLHIIFKGE